MDIVTIIFLITGIASIVLAIVAMVTASASEKRGQANFERTQEMMHKHYEDTQRMMQEIYDKTKNALSQIDKKAEIIENVVQRNQEHLMTTMTNLLNETVIPKKPNLGEELGMQFISSILQNPSDAKERTDMLKDLADLAKGFQANKE